MLVNYLIMVGLCVIGFVLGYLLTITVPLSRFKAFDLRPFNCRPCLTFWLTLAFQIGLYFVIKSFAILLLGIAAAFAMYLALKIDDNKTIID